jgi:hypothetical protein
MFRHAAFPVLAPLSLMYDSVSADYGRARLSCDCLCAVRRAAHCSAVPALL